MKVIAARTGDYTVQPAVGCLAYFLAGKSCLQRLANLVKMTGVEVKPREQVMGIGGV